MSRFRSLALTLGLSAHLAGLGLSATQGFVLCLESDGRVQVEAAAPGLSCGSAPLAGLRSTADPHCAGCRDVPLLLKRVEARAPALRSALHPAAPLAAVLATTPATAFQFHQALAAASSSPRPQRAAFLRSTVLRI